MKKFSTIAFALAFPLALSTSAFGQDEGRTGPAPLSSKCNFLPDAPDKHVVVKGDTLWGISGKFLQNPWCWPEVWGMNKDEIKNPHWIYPKQIVYFDRVNGRLRLGTPLGEGGGNGVDRATDVVKLLPQVRTLEGDRRQAIPAIPNNLIEPYLTQPLIIDKDQFATAPRIVAAQEGRVYMGKGDKVYVRGNLNSVTSFQVYRPGKPLKDPDTREVIAYEAMFVGTVKLEKRAKTEDGVDTFIATTSKEEMGVGDRLVPLPPTPIINYVPHRPQGEVKARVVGVYGGVSVAGQNQVISINRGSDVGLDVGSVLELSRYGKVIPDRTDDKKLIRLPDETYGRLFIFRVFPKISYGLIMEVSDTVNVGDQVQSPER